eukprot:GILI01011270.1.p1 GENE.GILI01011270.1~~GILI01011270.1.p1  ORF type:complete len:337 (+),score=103.16 GILI01011270.1:91-1101(+)
METKTNPKWDEAERPRIAASRVNSAKQDFKFLNNTTTASIIFAKSCAGQPKRGPENAPPIVGNEEFMSIIRELGWQTEIVQAEEIHRDTPEEINKTLKNACTVAATNDNLAGKIAEAHKKNQFVLTIGGDHSLAMGTVRGATERFKDLRLIWVDAHADINLPETSPSGNIHGMPLAFLLGLANNHPPFEDNRYHCLSTDRLAYIALRDVDEGEHEIIAKHNMRGQAYFMEDVQKIGIRETVKQILQKINPNNEHPVMISFDVDGMDPIDAPATGTAVPMGLRLHEGIELIKMVRETGCLVSLDVMEVNPDLGDEKELAVTIANARELIAHALGHTQ